jgi:hypothetical protein
MKRVRPRKASRACLRFQFVSMAVRNGFRGRGSAVGEERRVRPRRRAEVEILRTGVEELALLFKVVVSIFVISARCVW